MSDITAGETVTVYTVQADGSLGAALGSATSAADGSFTVNLAAVQTGLVEVVAVGGTYTSEADGRVVTTGALRFLLAVVGSAGVSGVVVSPLTDMAAQRALALLSGGTRLTDAINAALTLVQTNYGFAGSLAGLVPAYKASSVGTDGFLLGMVLGSLESCAVRSVGASRGDLYTALSLDFSDGLFDGLQNGVPVALGGGALSSTARTSDFLSCVSGYASSGAAITAAGLSAADVASTVTTLRSAVATSPATPPSAGLSAGSSGAISSLAFGGKQWVHFAARANGVTAVDVTDPAAAAPTNKNFALNAIFGGAQIGGVVPLLGADHPQLLRHAYGSKHVALVNAETGIVDYAGDLPLASSYPVSFSGGSAYIAGAIPDTGRDGVWLATADGYYFFNRATTTLETLYPIDSADSLAENLGSDVGHGLLFAANNGPCVQLVDLNAATSYY